MCFCSHGAPGKKIADFDQFALCSRTKRESFGLTLRSMGNRIFEPTELLTGAVLRVARPNSRRVLTCSIDCLVSGHSGEQKVHDPRSGSARLARRGKRISTWVSPALRSRVHRLALFELIVSRLCPPVDLTLAIFRHRLNVGEKVKNFQSPPIGLTL